jgi:acetylornithine deacetylase
LHKTLVSIPSTTGTEQHVGNTLADYLSSLGYNVERQFLPQPDANGGSSNAINAPPRFNLLASRPLKSGTRRRHGAQPRILVTSHIDAVPPHIPYSISDAEHPGLDTVIRGRGSVDDKASVAAQITALEELRRQGEVEGDEVMLLFVVGEETTGDGMHYFSSVAQKDGLKFEAAIFGEPTEGKLACGHKGHAACTIRAKGKAGHSGYPWLGKSATEVIARLLVKVLDEDLGSSERFGNSTVNVGSFEGGVAANVIAEHATTSIALRIAAGNQATGWNIVRKKLEDMLKEVDEEALSMECTNGYGPIECDCDVKGRSIRTARRFLPLMSMQDLTP